MFLSRVLCLATIACAVSLAPRASIARVPLVVTDIPPVQSLVAQVMGTLGRPDLLVSQGAEPHSYQLRPSQAAALGRADLVFWVGPEMTPWLTRVLAADSRATAVGLLAAKGVHLRQFSGGGDETGTDPHAWLDPENAAAWLAAIRDALVAADADHAADYARNYAAAKAALENLTAEVGTSLAPAGQSPIVVGHDAYGYFADRFQLTIAATVEAGDASEPGAAKLSQIAAMLKANRVKCLFPEAGHDPKRAAALIDGTTTRLGDPLDPEGRTIAPGPDLYATLMRQLGRAIAACQMAP